jgi:addiction module HigA family antidote
MSDRMLPIHPGEILLEDFMKPMDLSQTRLALDTGIPQSRIQAIVAGKRGISADTAVRFAAYFGNSAEFWLNCQTTYELDMVDYSGRRDEILNRVHPRTSTVSAASPQPTA